MTRDEFEATPWLKDAQGAPVNPSADPDCNVCDGFGVTERRSTVGDRFEAFENCPQCWRPKLTPEDVEKIMKQSQEG